METVFLLVLGIVVGLLIPALLITAIVGFVSVSLRRVIDALEVSKAMHRSAEAEKFSRIDRPASSDDALSALQRSTNTPEAENARQRASEALRLDRLVDGMIGLSSGSDAPQGAEKALSGRFQPVASRRCGFCEQTRKKFFRLFSPGRRVS